MACRIGRTAREANVRALGRNGPKDSRKASQVLMSALTASDSERVAIEDLLSALDRRAFGVVLLLVALVNCVPLPPGISTLMGIPVFLLGLQMVLARRQPWLPAALRRRTLRRADLVAGLSRIERWLRRVERLSKPRLPAVAALMVPRLTGAVVVVLSLYIMMPLVFTNIPPALAVAFIAIGLIENDGLMLALGVPVAAIALAVSTVLAAGTLTVLYIGVLRQFGL